MRGVSISRDGYGRKLAAVSNRIIAAQKPIRILWAITWPDSVRQRFFEQGARELPRYDYPALRYEPAGVHRDLRDIMRRLDAKDPVHGILSETCEQYALVVDMLAARGTPRFHQISRALYGAPADRLLGTSMTNLDLARHLGAALGGHHARLGPRVKGRISSRQAAAILRRRLSRFFKDDKVIVQVSGRLTADAAAGANKVKVKKGVLFTPRDLKYLEHHEGHVHVATTLNGLRQPYLKCLAKASPRSTRYNEGLAVFAEWAGQSLTVRRLMKLKERVVGIRMAEEGADFLDVYHHHLGLGYESEEAFEAARRVFRGGDVRGRWPFTKDVSYLASFIRVFNFLRLAVKLRRYAALDLLFVGKVSLEDVPVLGSMMRRRLVERPRYLPPWARNKNWLACHMALASFVDRIRLPEIERYDARLLGESAD